jgi:hypothetical protein
MLVYLVYKLIARTRSRCMHKQIVNRPIVAVRCCHFSAVKLDARRSRSIANRRPYPGILGKAREICFVGSDGPRQAENEQARQGKRTHRWLRSQARRGANKESSGRATYTCSAMGAVTTEP